MQLFDGLVIETQVLLTTDENDRKALAEVKDLGDPLQRWVSNGCDIESRSRGLISYLLLNVV